MIQLYLKLKSKLIKTFNPRLYKIKEQQITIYQSRLY